MTYRVMIFLLLMMSAYPAHAVDYVAQRDGAAALMNDRAYNKALERLKSLAEADVSAAQKTHVLELAVRCLLHLDRPDDAMAMAEKLPNKAAARAARLRIMMHRRQYEPVMAQFRDADIAAWPDYLKAEAYHLRGSAARRTGDTDSAVADLERALSWTYQDREQATIIADLAGLYLHQYDDPDKAIALYRNVAKRGNATANARSTVRIINIRIARGQADQALAEIENWLEHVGIESLSGDYWPAQMIAIHARALAAADRRDEALTRYQQALAVKPLHPRIKRRVQQALAELQDDPD